MTVSNNLKKEIIDKIDKTDSTSYIQSIYDNFLPDGYINQDCKPSEKLIFLKFDEFNNLIDDFFTKLNKHYEYFEIEYFKYPKQTPINYSARAIKDEKNKFLKKFIKVYEIIRDYFGAKLQDENELYICPYCEKNYINLVYTDDKTLKPDLDHYYPKAFYPFLGCSIENLIPACQVCNSRLKRDEDFYIKKHINPIEYRLFDEIIFSYDQEGIMIENTNDLKKYTEKENYLNTFKIEEIYAIHNEILDDIKVKYKMYNKSKQYGLMKSCPSLAQNEILDMVFYEYKNENKRTPFRKLKKDLYNNIKKNSTNKILY
ncbi:hypothetical protein M947_11695 [Sulfurimonas hongkongensis]|uniref:HNH domain-containing protein n=1 Tax=Sulfurimonas hongkongensis TaxID=1172190 RepID=T0KC38_9BACT|nr:hypothetical protein [Sulfurimonas hongkongensis]EQB34294.1 hypothetical protein M947_11695 [Sulfurimonas hongkongensis]